MGSVIVVSGPVGAGKSTVAKQLVAKMPAPVAYIEGDHFWSCIAKTASADRREDGKVILRAMTAAALPFARSGYQVVLDFSIPPQFLPLARKILKEIPLRYVVLLPGMAVCAARAAARSEGRITDYGAYKDYYALFTGAEDFTVRGDDVEADAMAAYILAGLDDGQFRVEDGAGETPKAPAKNSRRAR